MKLCQISSCILILLATIYVTSSQYFCNFSQNFLGDLQLTLQQVWNVSLNQTASEKGLCVVMVLGTRRIKTYAIIRVCMHLFVPKLNLRNGINSSVTKKKKTAVLGGRSQSSTLTSATGSSEQKHLSGSVPL